MASGRCCACAPRWWWSPFPSDLLEAARNFHVGRLVWWRRVILPGILPGILPYYVTGAIAARGIGAYIADATASGSAAQLLLGVFILSRYVMAMNTLLWQPLSRRAHRRAA